MGLCMVTFKYNIDEIQPDKGMTLQTKLADESRCVQDLLSQTRMESGQIFEIQENTRFLVEKVREKKIGGLAIDAILLKYKLATQEGIALMCLAEAMMRVPDNKTLDDLISDKLQTGAWGAQVAGESLFVNAAGWGLLLTGRIMKKASFSGVEKVGKS